MANRRLCASAWLLLVVPHFWAVYACRGCAPLLLRGLYVVGPCTSVWNHGTTSAAALWADRAAMALGCVVDCCFAIALLTPSAAAAVLALDAAAVACYAVAKRKLIHNGSDAAHMASHACVSAAHLLLLMLLLHGC